MPITKHNYIVKDVNQLADTIRSAFVIAKSGRPGPVRIDIPKDVTANTAEYEYKEPEEAPRYIEEIREEDLDRKLSSLFSMQKDLLFLSAAV